MSGLKTPVFHVGANVRQGLRQIPRRAKDRGVAIDGGETLSADAQAALFEETSMFTQFLCGVITSFQGEDFQKVREQRTMEMDPSLPTAEFSLQYWNTYAERRLVGTTPIPESQTMMTLLQFFGHDPGKEQQTMLSLGAGYGIKELFLAYRFPHLGLEQKIICLDNAEQMIKAAREIARTVVIAKKGDEPKPARNISHLHGDMLAIPMPDESVEHIVCLESLQWTADWKKAIDEMARVIEHKRTSTLLLSTRIRPLTMASAVDGRVVRRLGDFEVPELLDYLERRRFKIKGCRQLIGVRDRDQRSGNNDELFIRAHFVPAGVKKSWREVRGSLGLGGMFSFIE